MEIADKGKVETIIDKDMNRLERAYLNVDMYAPNADVQFVAINADRFLSLSRKD